MFTIYRKETKGPAIFQGSAPSVDLAQVLLATKAKEGRQYRDGEKTEIKENAIYVVQKETNGDIWEEYKNVFLTVVVPGYLWNGEERVAKPELIAEWGILEVPATIPAPMSTSTRMELLGMIEKQFNFTSGKEACSDKDLYNLLASSIAETVKKCVPPTTSTPVAVVVEEEKTDEFSKWMCKKKEKILSDMVAIEFFLASPALISEVNIFKTTTMPGMKKADYSRIEEDGLPVVGTPVKPGDILAQKTIR